MGFPEGSTAKAPRGIRFALWGLLWFEWESIQRYEPTKRRGDAVKKIILFGLVIAFLPALLFAQEKIGAPVWNVGDKWAFTGDGSIEVVKVDPGGFILNFSDRKCMVEKQGCKTILFEKSTRNRINVVDGDKRKKYVMGLSKILDFPLSIGKEWKSAYSATELSRQSGHNYYYDYSEIFKILGLEDIEVRAGKFKALRLEYKRVVTSSSWTFATIGEEIKHQYWYSPEVKYFVKCKYDKDWMKGNKDIFNWELTFFQLKK